MDDKNYNGWTNYATWRVNLEIFDGILISEWFHPKNGRPDESDVAEYLKDYVEELIASETQANAREGVSRGYALAFLNGVNWHEIAQHLLDDIEWEEDENEEV